jgi:hypothetical protein
VPLVDAKGLVNTYGGACGAPRPAKERAQILLQGCSEIATCAGSCRRALATAASNASTPAEADRALVDCFAEFKKDHEGNGLSREDFAFRYVSAYADRVLATRVLDAEGAKLLTDWRANCATK